MPSEDQARGVVLLVLCALLVCTVRAEGQVYYAFPSIPDELAEQAPLELSVEDCVHRAVDINYDVAIRRQDVKAGKAGVMSARGAFEPSLYASAGRSSSSDTNATQDTDSGEVGLRTRWITGTEISLSTDYSEQSDETNGSASVAAQLTQPLLKGARIRVVRAPIVTAQRNRDISVHQLTDQIINTITGVEDLYWNLVAARARYKVQEDSLKYSRDLEDLTIQRADAGLMSDSDVVEAQAAAFAQEADVVRAAESVRSIEDNLKEELAYLEQPALWLAPIVPTTEPDVTLVDVEFLQSLRLALENRPDYRSALLRLKNADLSLYVAKNNLLPQLDLVARGERNDEVDGPGAAFDAASNSDDEIWSIFLRLEIPLGNKEARAARDRARADLEQQLLSIKKLELGIIKDVRRAVDSLNTSKLEMVVTKRAMELEQQKLQNERDKLDLGKSTTDNVVRFIQSLNNSQLRHVQAMINYKQALVRLEQVQGTTLAKYGVTIDENL